jgi:hypothetical protein
LVGKPGILSNLYCNVHPNVTLGDPDVFYMVSVGNKIYYSCIIIIIEFQFLFELCTAEMD